QGPLVGAFELPISQNHGSTEPADAVRIETSLGELRVNGQKVLDLQSGRVPANELSGDHVITKLQQQISSSRSRARAAVWINASTPYGTLAEVLKTLETAGVHEADFAVRQGMDGPATGWMKLTHWRVVPAGEDIVPFTEQALPWTAFTDHWHDI